MDKISTTRYWVVDAFADAAFKGNPAGIFGLNEPLSDEKMLRIAAELNLPISVFLRFADESKTALSSPIIRFFTPTGEIPLCGHGTLACSHVYFTEIAPDQSRVLYNTMQAGPISVSQLESPVKFYQMEFPLLSYAAVEISSVSSDVVMSVAGQLPIQAYRSESHLLLVYQDDDVIYNMSVDHFGPISEKTIIVTSRSVRDARCDFVSRVFHKGVEDAVCGSAHCTSAHYWARALSKTEMTAFQASPRGGVLMLDVDVGAGMMKIGGKAVTVCRGELLV